MATNGVTAQIESKTTTSRRSSLIISGLMIRVLIAFVISWLIVLAFFATSVISH